MSIRLSCISSSRRGITSFNMLVMLLRMIFMIIALLAIVIIINVAMNLRLESKSGESSLLIARMLYGTDGISYQDKITGRVMAGVIELSTLNETQDRINEGIYIRSNNRISARAEVYYTPLGWTLGYKFGGEVKYNPDLFDAYEPLSRAWRAVGGVGGVTSFDVAYPVIVILPSGERRLGKLEFKVLIPAGAK